MSEDVEIQLWREENEQLRASLVRLQRVEAAAKEISKSQGRMRDDWADGDENKKTSLWVELHRAGNNLFDALTGSPPPADQERVRLERAVIEAAMNLDCYEEGQGDLADACSFLRVLRAHGEKR